ncbi:MAG: adenylate/guanylate cyclase domain-containing protein [Bacteroidota bacterium]
MFSYRFRHRLQRWFTLTVVWLIVALILAFQKHLMLHSELVGEHLPISMLVTIKSEMFGAFLGAIFGGALMIFFFQDRFRDWKLINAILIQAAIYIPMMLSVTMVASFFYNSLSMNLPFWDKAVAIKVIQFMGSADQLVIFLNWSIILVISVWVLAISEKFGPGQLTKMLLGKYHKPTEETRIFMFLDLKGATTLAEKIGHQLYFDLLKKSFDEITEPVLMSKGEIYQYVGDEVVISWTLENGLTNNNCIDCYFRIQDKLRSSKPYFLSKFGIIPDFKAGVHVGKVMVGEVGMAKRERIFSGDVLNTASRIQGQCKAFDLDILISGELESYLIDRKGLEIEFLEAATLKGKNSYVNLYSVKKGKTLHVRRDTDMITVA